MNKIGFDYRFDVHDLIKDLKKNSDIEVIYDEPRIKVENTYYKAGHKGTNQCVYTRKSVNNRLKFILKSLPNNLGLIIFDAFRSLETQGIIFDLFYAAIKADNPNMSEQEVIIETKKFVSHPDDKTIFEIPPHNSGGSIDIAIFDINTDEILEFGTDFDDLTSMAKTDYFEVNYIDNTIYNEQSWNKIRDNRRLLYNLMTENGFVSCKNEWWHYSIGDCLWASELGLKWIYSSIEKDIFMKYLG